jgi:hypothetical protein
MELKDGACGPEGLTLTYGGADDEDGNGIRISVCDYSPNERGKRNGRRIGSSFGVFRPHELGPLGVIAATNHSFRMYPYVNVCRKDPDMELG